MKAVVLKEFGGVENLNIEDIEIPEIGKDEVLVKVAAISINPVDIKTREGSAQADNIKNDSPMILGWDISGTITKIGETVQNFQENDEVFGTIRFPGHGKAYAEYVTAPASELALKPKNTTHEEATAATLAALTAWKALVTYSNVKAGDKVLIHGASGGVGHYAVQIAKHFGAHVIGTASGNNKEFVMKLGADEFIDYKTQKFEEVVKDLDIIIDSVGGENFARSVTVLKPGGAIVNLPTNKTEEAKKIVKENNIKNFHQMMVESDGEDMKSIAALLDKGSIKSYIDQSYKFDQIREAHLQIESGKSVGKVVVTL